MDNITYDLEDSVTPSEKPKARTNIRNFLEQPRAANVNENAVRINSVDSGYALDDLTEVVGFHSVLFTSFQVLLSCCRCD